MRHSRGSGASLQVPSSAGATGSEPCGSKRPCFSRTRVCIMALSMSCSPVCSSTMYSLALRRNLCHLKSGWCSKPRDPGSLGQPRKCCIETSGRGHDREPRCNRRPKSGFSTGSAPWKTGGRRFSLRGFSSYVPQWLWCPRRAVNTQQAVLVAVRTAGLAI